MRFTILYRDSAIGTVELPAGEFVAARLTPAAQYASIRAVVRRSTEVFLQLGLFPDALPDSMSSPLTVGNWRQALRDASRLHLGLANVHHHPIATRFVNLLEAPDDSGVITLVSFDRGSSRPSVRSVRNNPTGVAAASADPLVDRQSAGEHR